MGGFPVSSSPRAHALGNSGARAGTRGRAGGQSPSKDPSRRPEVWLSSPIEPILFPFPSPSLEDAGGKGVRGDVGRDLNPKAS